MLRRRELLERLTKDGQRTPAAPFRTGNPTLGYPQNLQPGGTLPPNGVAWLESQLAVNARANVLLWAGLLSAQSGAGTLQRDQRPCWHI